MLFDADKYELPSLRVSTYGGKGMVSTSNPLAAQAGLDVLKRGGNAVDAAVAAAACLTVVEPTNNGIGSDTFAMVWSGGKLYGLNSSGPAPQGISREALAAKGHKEMPLFGIVPINVPGAPGAWAELNRRFGKFSLPDVIAPAADYAERGFPVSRHTAGGWRFSAEMYRKQGDSAMQGWFDNFAPDGVTPEAGAWFRYADMANTLRSIADTGAESFYRGEYAERIDRFMRQHGGYLRKEDLEAFRPEWVEPIHVNYHGYDVWELPPNGQGIVALMALNILDAFEPGKPGDALTLHRQFEAMKLAYADGKRYVTDPLKMKVSVEDLLSKAYAEERRKLIGDRALPPEAGKPFKGGTVYVCAVDEEGTMVSLIQSNYHGFGSGIVIPGSGISLQNRGNNFSLDPNHDNCIAPGKRTFHTIIPAFMTKDGAPIGPFGVVGGFMQPQGHVQVAMNTIDYRMNPQQALDAPRWQWMEDRVFHMEGTLAPDTLRQLLAKGHLLSSGCGIQGNFGRGNIIWRQPNGVYVGACDARSDGTVAAY